jgi:hypothetical protein
MNQRIQPRTHRIPLILIILSSSLKLSASHGSDSNPFKGPGRTIGEMNHGNSPGSALSQINSPKVRKLFRNVPPPTERTIQASIPTLMNTPTNKAIWNPIIRSTGIDAATLEFYRLNEPEQLVEILQGVEHHPHNTSKEVGHAPAPPRLPPPSSAPFQAPSMTGAGKAATLMDQALISLSEVDPHHNVWKFIHSLAPHGSTITLSNFQDLAVTERLILLQRWNPNPEQLARILAARPNHPPDPLLEIRAGILAAMRDIPEHDTDFWVAVTTLLNIPTQYTANFADRYRAVIRAITDKPIEHVPLEALQELVQLSQSKYEPTSIPAYPPPDPNE